MIDWKWYLLTYVLGWFVAGRVAFVHRARNYDALMDEYWAARKKFLAHRTYALENGPKAPFTPVEYGLLCAFFWPSSVVVDAAWLAVKYGIVKPLQATVFRPPALPPPHNVEQRATEALEAGNKLLGD